MVALAQISRQTAVEIDGKKIRIPPRISLGEITPNNVGTLRKLNSVLFPVAYSDKFYADVLNPQGEDYCKLVFYQDLAVGNIICRLEPSVSSDNIASTSKVTKSVAVPSSYKLYIMTLGVLAAYRKQGLGSKMVQHIISAAEASHRPPVAEVYKIKLSEKDGDKKKQSEKAIIPSRPVVESLYLHVQISNTEARDFWLSHGFKVTSTIENYYRKIEPRAAYLLERTIVAEK